MNGERSEKRKDKALKGYFNSMIKYLYRYYV